MPEPRTAISKHIDIRDEYSALQNTAIGRSHSLVVSAVWFLDGTTLLGAGDIHKQIDAINSAITALENAKNQLRAANEYRDLLMSVR